MDQVRELRALYEAGKYMACQRDGERLLKESADELPAREKAEVYRYLVSCAVAVDDLFHAKVLATSERHWAGKAGDTLAMARAESHVAYIETHIGDTHSALEAMAQFLALDNPPRPDLAEQRAAVFFNRGTVFMQRRQPVDAVAEFAEARAAYERLKTPPRITQCDLEIAWAYLRAEQPERAAPHLNAAEALLQEYPHDTLRVTAINHRAFWHFVRGEYAQAVDLCGEVFAPGRPGVTDHHTAEAAWIMGECGLATGRLYEAEQLAALAEDRALKARSPWLLNQTGSLRRRIQDARKDASETA